MVRLYLPIGPNSEPYPNPRTKKQELLNRLWKTRTLIPGAKDMSETELTDYVQRQEFKMKEEQAKQLKEVQKKVSKYEHQQTIGALKEYIAWRKRKEVS